MMTSSVHHYPRSPRWKDVNQHWNSLCKLLQETLLRLEATYAEVRHVLQIRTEEFDWLDNCEHIGYMRRPIRGNLDTVQQEIEAHEVNEMMTAAAGYCVLLVYQARPLFCPTTFYPLYPHTKKDLA